ncbi:unnamed protein product [Sphenostylis stenocarpa]|uniref:Uncharacterized protein n=1 Tax=Sphenostylis stenocarpa TaxID=92480 RepID=A0AA86S3B3_9FABA|nr:unnamed protein product [Sphenostylis stenocarpa]
MVDDEKGKRLGFGLEGLTLNGLCSGFPDPKLLSQLHLQSEPQAAHIVKATKSNKFSVDEGLDDDKRWE